MLIRFVVSNFLSFNEETEFNMLAGSFRNHKHHVYKTSKLNILKGAALYGANGAGKSNLVKAIDFLQNIIDEGKLEKSVNSKKFKLDRKNIDKPIEFEIEFYYKKKIYVYGISINGLIIEKEWLYISGIEKEDKLIFERETKINGKSKIKFLDKYVKTQKYKQLIELFEDNILRNNETLLGKYDILKITDINNVNKWIVEKLVILYPESRFGMLAPVITIADELAPFINKLLKTFNTGVEKLQIKDVDFDIYFGKEDKNIKNELLEELSEGRFTFVETENRPVLVTKKNNQIIVKKVISIHKDIDNNQIKFDLIEESDGTIRLLDIIPAFYNILNSETTVIIDEIDQSLHPSLLFNFIKKIMDNETTKGQLIFTTHESNLLDLNIFRQDEIWFAEKNNVGATQLYSLSDFKPRYDLDIRKGYLKGRFGAIPFLGDLKKLKWERDDA